MVVKLLVLHCLVASCMAWLPPERCAQDKVLDTTSNPVKVAALTVDIAEIAAKQHEHLVQTYKDRKFVGVPVRGIQYQFFPPIIQIQVPFNCSFITYEPRLLSSVVCDTGNCKLSHTVTTTDSYTASEGYNWGVKISSKASVFDLFEAGGEVSTGGTYSCTYTKGRTTSDVVECSDNTIGIGNLLLYNVQSDMICDFGEITLETDVRDGNSYYFSATDLNNDEVVELRESVLETTFAMPYMYLIDMEKISDRLLNKIKNLVPLYNPYTDYIEVFAGFFKVYYLKETKFEKEYRRSIPFTKENGDSVYQYACTKQPF